MYASKRSVVLSLAPLLCAVSAFPQAGVASIDHANQLGKETMRLMREKQIFAVPTFPIFEYFADHAASAAQGARERQMLDLHVQEFRKHLARGVPMAVGTDVGPFPPNVGFSFDARATSTAAAVDGAGPATEVPTESLPLAPSACLMELCVGPASWDGSFSAPEERLLQSDAPLRESPATPGSEPGDDSKIQPLAERLRVSKPADFNRDIYYRNKLEFSLDGGWHPINIPFPLDVFVGDVYNTYPLKYTLVPIFASLRWHMDGVGGPWILRGNWDLTSTASVTAIPRGPETRYFAYLMGIRRNFVPRKERIAPYFDVRLGVGSIDAKGPKGVLYAQGQDLTFTVNMGSGVRYNFNPRYAISAGMNFMHISNLDLSQHKGPPNWGIRNYGINVYGPMVGIDIQLRGHRRHSE